jgi:DNA-binding beta-propeller fold protein YncE
MNLPRRALLILGVLTLGLATAVSACNETRSTGASPTSTSPDAGDAASEAAVSEQAGGQLSILAGSSATGFLDGKGPLARFNGPAGGILLRDGSALVIADTFNAVLRRVALPGGEVTTVAGRVQVQATADGAGLQARFQSPRAMTISADGTTAFVADGPSLRRVDLGSFAVTTVAGTPGSPGYADGTGPTVRLGFLLHALEMSEDGKVVFMADRSNQVLRTYDTTTGAVATVAGTRYSGEPQAVDGVGKDARLSGVGGLARVGGAVFVADTFNHCIRRFDIATAMLTTVAGRCGQAGAIDGVGNDARFDTPQTLVVNGAYLYTGGFSGSLRRIALGDFAVETVLGADGDVRSVDGPKGVARLGALFAQPMVDATGNALWLADRDANSLRRVDLANFSVATVAGAREPQALRDGSLAEARFDRPGGVAATSDGSSVFVSELGLRVLRRIQVGDGTVTTFAGTGAAGSVDGPIASATFTAPGDLVMDDTGSVLYVADGTRIRAIELALGAVRTLAGASPAAAAPQDGKPGTGSFAQVSSMVFDASNGRLLVADVRGASAGRSAYVALRAVDIGSGEISTITGGAAAKSPVDGALADARFTSIGGLAFDAKSNRVFLSDDASAALRVVDLTAGEVQLFAGEYGVEGPADGDLATTRFNSPSSLLLSVAERALFVADTGGHTVRRISLDAGRTTTLLGDPSRNGGLPYGATVPFSDSTLYFPDRLSFAAGALVLLSEGAVYRAVPRTPFAP